MEKAVQGIKQLDLVKDSAKFLIGTAAGWIWKLLYDRWKMRKALDFWRPFLAKDLRIVLGRFGEFDDFERSGLLGVGDAIALAELQSFLATMGTTEPQLCYADRIRRDGDALKHPLILLGGPDVNAITHEVSKLLRTGLRFGDPTIHEITFRDILADPPRVYSPNVPTALQTGSDLGLIFRAPNPFAPDKPALIIAGSFGHGTWAAARYLMSPEFLRSQAAKHRSLEGLIETDIALDTPQQIRCLVLRPIGSAAPNELGFRNS
jgi:hypothetical protein